MARTKKASGPGDEIAKLPFDNYTVVEMNRSDLVGSDYNPRVMGEQEKKRLRAVLKKHGMVQPPTWNKRTVGKGWPEGSTGVIVGGHQRLSQLDSLHGSKHYTLQVAVVDVTDSEEKELNISLNNPSAQGDWDLEALEKMLSDPEIDIVGTGFDYGDIMRLFGDIPGGSQPAVEQLAEQLRKFQDAYKNISDNEGRDDFYCVLVFRDYNDRLAFLKAAGCDDNRYQSGAAIRALITKDGAET